MTDERIEELWTKARYDAKPNAPVRFVFAYLVAAETARECAEVALAMKRQYPLSVRLDAGFDPACNEIAAAIRRKFLEGKRWLNC